MHPRTSNRSEQWKPNCNVNLIFDSSITLYSIAPDRARMGDLNIEDSEDDQFAQEINIAEVIRHEKHRFISSYYDIALFRLEKPIKSV